MTSQMSLDLCHKADDGAFYVIIKVAFSERGPIATSYGKKRIILDLCIGGAFEHSHCIIHRGEFPFVKQGISQFVPVLSHKMEIFSQNSSYNYILLDPI